MRRGVTLVFVSVLLLLFSQAARAQIHVVSVAVDGLACPFCSYGVEKKLKKLRAVETIDIDIQNGLVVIYAEKGKSIEVSRVTGAVRDAGFSARRLTVTASGVLEAANGGLLLRWDGQSLGVSPERGLRKRMISYSEEGTQVEIRGTAREVSGGKWTLIPDKVEPE